MAAHEKRQPYRRGLFQTRVAGLRREVAAENIAAGFLTFSETLKQWGGQRRPSREPADGRGAADRRCLGVKTIVTVSQVLGDDHHRLNSAPFPAYVICVAAPRGTAGCAKDVNKIGTKPSL